MLFAILGCGLANAGESILTKGYYEDSHISCVGSINGAKEMLVSYKYMGNLVSKDEYEKLAKNKKNHRHLSQDLVFEVICHHPLKGKISEQSTILVSYSMIHSLNRWKDVFDSKKDYIFYFEKSGDTTVELYHVQNVNCLKFLKDTDLFVTRSFQNCKVDPSVIDRKKNKVKVDLDKLIEEYQKLDAKVDQFIKLKDKSIANLHKLFGKANSKEFYSHDFGYSYIVKGKHYLFVESQPREGEKHIRAVIDWTDNAKPKLLWSNESGKLFYDVLAENV